MSLRLAYHVAAESSRQKKSGRRFLTKVILIYDLSSVVVLEWFCLALS